MYLSEAKNLGYTSSFGLPSSGETARTANDEDKTITRPRREFARRLERFITAHQRKTHPLNLESDA